jgi:hypothetical protein
MAMVGVGLLVAPIGLFLLTGDLLKRTALSSKHPLLLLAPGLGTIFCGWFFLVLFDLPATYAAIGAVVLFLLVGAITSETDVDITAIVVMAALIWSFAPRTEPLRPSVTPSDGETVILALGDSFMSGEGAIRFFEGTNTEGSNECRRAPTAYAPLTVELTSNAIPDNLVFLACSGAKARHVWDIAQYPEEPSLSGDERYANLPQLGYFRSLQNTVNLEVELVLISIGGNDAGFGDIGRTCVLPGNCAVVADQWLSNLEYVRETAATAYEKMRAVIGDVPVLVVPYPVPIRETGCPHSSLTDTEHAFLNGFVHELNDVLHREAQVAGFYFLENMELSLKERELRICDRGPDSVGVNFVGLNPTDGLLEERLNPSNWTHNSLHPKALGHRVMRDELAEWIEGHPNLEPRVPRPNLDPYQISSLSSILGPNFQHCGNAVIKHCDDPDTWAMSQIAIFISIRAPFLLAIVFGAWWIWLQLFRLRRHHDGWTATLGSVFGRRRARDTSG